MAAFMPARMLADLVVIGECPKGPTIYHAPP
jgi:hypothetical protein